jgi:propanol-preferring alcohol dehydrogenase
MKAMLLKKICRVDNAAEPLVAADVPDPRPADDEILIRVSACGVCHTELDEIEGRLPPPRLPVVPGHQVVGQVAERGKAVKEFKTGDRVGVAWIFSACGRCRHCRGGAENLCDRFRATGRDADGGYAQYMKVRAAFAHRIPDLFSDVEAAPLLCAGAIGYRSLKLTGIGDGDALGLTGFGASAHLVLKMAMHRYPGLPVYVFARNPDVRQFALSLGAAWAGDTGDRCPADLDAIIDTTPAWKPVVSALANLRAGGRLVINAIRKERRDQNELLRLSYPEHLWLEKEVKSVANVTRSDVRDFLDLAAEIPMKPRFQEYDLADANQALRELRAGGIRGAKVLRLPA